MTPVRWEWDDSPLITDDEGDGERVVGVVAREVVKVEDGDDEVEGSADAEVDVAIVEKVRTDPEVVGRVVGKLDGDSAGEDEPP